MLLVGILYLLFENSVLADPKSTPHSTLDSMTKMILGLQIGLIALAMIVTRSSVASLQAKRGLPLGNQVVGWFVLGKALSSQPCHLPADFYSCILDSPFHVRLTT